MQFRVSNPVLRGGLLALLAAALFGLSTPFVQLWGKGLGPFTTAGLLYAGAAVAALFMRRPAEREARLQRSDASRLLAMAFFGAVLGPVALAWGLQHTSGTSASLMLTLEAVFTALLAWRLYGETVDRRVVSAMLLLLGGGVLLALDQGLQGGTQFLGLLAVMVATVAWGVDNTLSRGVADRDPGQVVLTKAILGTLATFVLAVSLSEPLPAWSAALALLAIGASGYPNLSAAVADIAHPSWRASAIGIYRFWRDLGYGVGALGLGLASLWGGSVESAFWFVAASMFLSGLALYIWGEETHPRLNPAH